MRKYIQSAFAKSYRKEPALRAHSANQTLGVFRIGGRGRGGGSDRGREGSQERKNAGEVEEGQ